MCKVLAILEDRCTITPKMIFEVIVGVVVISRNAEKIFRRVAIVMEGARLAVEWDA